MGLWRGGVWGGWEIVGVLVGTGDDWGEAVGDLVGNYDRAIVKACQFSELSAKPYKLDGACSERGRDVRTVTLSAIVGGDGIDNHEPDVVS